MSPIQVTNGAEGRNVGLIHDHLRSAILRGELAPGDELSQVRLARHLGVSRTPPREALRMLLTAYTTRAERAWAAGLDEHRRIIDACKARDADAAAAALVDHLGHTALGVIELVEPSYDAAALQTAIEAVGSPVR